MRSKRDINYKKILSLFWKQNGSPLFNAKGLAIGVFSGCFPFFGFQTLIGVFFAKLAKGNIVLAAIGTWISNPFTYVPLYYFNYKIGSILIKNSSNKIIEKNLAIHDLWKQGSIFSIKLLLGSTCVGLLFAFIAGSIAFVIYNTKNNR
ncbi:DUF2062 domain-containing protein [Prochlorococcus marinus XMU1419]|uniref:DUF2062 domain-containing protein n=1 Tax=Prochlorococcus marinus TaxID=1219 RepID=UPI001ADB781B|nr:DUF2062 domain-containing protein [Prochlorococcus marinus]MBO8233093.1 DUF2062 domain-containing protein [Prochlorococcus marinus XMU1419]MBW3076579.1 DUF2062 domain-containing protein [Prochlorococcus marinus str. XMU1419]